MPKLFQSTVRRLVTSQLERNALDVVDELRADAGAHVLGEVALDRDLGVRGVAPELAFDDDVVLRQLVEVGEVLLSREDPLPPPLVRALLRELGGR